jgi:hypothetical protein
MISEATSCVDIHFGNYNSTAGLSCPGFPHEHPLSSTLPDEFPPPKLDVRNKVLINLVVSYFFKESLRVSIAAMASEMAATSFSNTSERGTLSSSRVSLRKVGRHRRVKDTLRAATTARWPIGLIAED